LQVHKQVLIFWEELLGGALHCQGQLDALVPGPVKNALDGFNVHAEQVVLLA
jgi:hypothetical protein